MAPGSSSGKVIISTSLENKDFQSGIQSIVKSIKDLAAAVGVAFGIKAIVDFGKSAATVAAEFVRVKGAALIVGQMFGYTIEQVQSMTGGLVSMGIQTDVANKSFLDFARNGLDTSFLPALARGAQDLNAFAESGMSSSDVFNNLLYGILTLQPEVLRTAGAAVDLQAAFDSYAKSAGKSSTALSIQEKRQAALLAVTEKLRGVNGLYEMSQKTAAGQMSSNIRLTNEFQAALGTPFQNALYSLVKGWNDILKTWTAAIAPGGRLYGLMVNIGAVAAYLANGMTALAQMMADVFGAPVNKAANQTADSTKGAADAQSKLADATKDAAKAAKGSLAAFDELNVLQDKNAAGSAEPAPIPGADIVTPVDGMFEEIKKKAAELGTILNDILGPILTPLQAPFDGLMKAISDLGGTIWDGLKWAYENILLPVGTWLMQSVAPVFLDLLSAALDVLNEVLIALQPLGQWLWNDFIKPAGEWAGQAVVDGLKFLTDRLKELSDWISTNQETVQFFTVIVASFFAAWKVEQLAVSIAQLVIHLGTATATLATNTAAWIAHTAALIADKAEDLAIMALYAGDFIKNIALAAVRIAEETAAWIASTIAKVAANVAQIALNIATGIWNGIAVVAAAVTWAFGAAVAFLTSPIGLVIIAIVAIIAVIVLLITHWDWVKQKAGEVWTTIQQLWQLAGIWFQQNVVDPIRNAFQSVLDWLPGAWNTAFNGVVGFVKNGANSVIDFINGMIRAVAQGLNGIIGGLNGIRIDIPSWVTDITGLGGSWGLNIPLVNAPQIPRLATGGVIPANAQMLAMLGDNKTQKEIVSPEDLMRKIVREEMGNAGSDITVAMPVYLDGRVIYENQQRISRQRGTSLITGGIS